MLVTVCPPPFAPLTKKHLRCLLQFLIQDQICQQENNWVKEYKFPDKYQNCGLQQIMEASWLRKLARLVWVRGIFIIFFGKATFLVWKNIRLPCPFDPILTAVSLACFIFLNNKEHQCLCVLSPLARCRVAVTQWLMGHPLLLYCLLGSEIDNYWYFGM